MGHYTGIQIDLRITRTLPAQLATWLAKHVMGEGNLEEMNNMFTAGDGILFPNWNGGSLKFVDDHPEYGSHWHFKTNGCTKRYDPLKLAFFLHEIEPWLVMKENEILARTIYEEQESKERLFWISRDTTLVKSCYGMQFTYDHTSDNASTDHPRKWSVEELNEPLGLVTNRPTPKWRDIREYPFPRNSTVSPKLEEKRILNEQYNKKYAEDRQAEILAKLKEMENQ